VGVHALRKTPITNALQNGAPSENVRQLAGLSDIRSTQLYYKPSAKNAGDAAHIFRFGAVRERKGGHL
jgi:site-specific recombinase XerD